MPLSNKLCIDLIKHNHNSAPEEKRSAYLHTLQRFGQTLTAFGKLYLIEPHLAHDAINLAKSALTAKNDLENPERLKEFVSAVENFISRHNDEAVFTLINNDFATNHRYSLIRLLAQYIIICEPLEGIIPRARVRLLPDYLIKAVDESLLRRDHGDLQVKTNSDVLNFFKKLEEKSKDPKYSKEIAEELKERPLSTEFCMLFQDKFFN